MLKALELIGFKSFADKTRFEFPEGITVVVGPNGSGKSNIVDGIKWVLGEQSAKSLRGKEMSDVIFKGTGQGGRKAANTAEATVVFDNSQATFPVDAPEVHVTRRVYRSGEGEYLINGKPCRLRDIRDMFRGTGVGVDAYSLIEQGKVDSLLQASSKDRRAIFEEAAGISRFKAKKIEAQRRLDRVEQNLLRLSDIVDEVESRLRSVRAQASKAQRYREYSERLQQLRTQVGVTDWRKLTERMQAIELELGELTAQTEALSTESDEYAQRLQEIGALLDQSGESLLEKEADLAAAREQIASRETSISEERLRHEEYVEEARRQRKRLRAVTGRAGDLHAQLSVVEAELAQAETEHREIAARVTHGEQAAEDLSRHVDHVRQQHQTRRAEYVDWMRSTATLGNEVSGLESQQRAYQANGERLARRQEELRQTFEGHAARLEESRREEQRLSADASAKAEALEAAEVELAESRNVVARRQEELGVLQGQLSGARQRTQVLEELEQQRTGLSEGVTQILDLVTDSEETADEQIHGMVADLLEADVEVAPLIDLALGETAQHIVHTGGDLLQKIRGGQLSLRGRVGLLRLDAHAAATPLRFGTLGIIRPADLNGRSGVIGRADQLIRVRSCYRAMFHRLLGDTWFVHGLEDALELSRTAGRGMRFVTTDGEMVESDGTLILGPAQAASGIVSRRSELRELQREMLDVQARVTEFTEEITRLQENIDRQDRNRKLLADVYRTLQTTLADQRVQTRSLEQHHQTLEKELQTLAGEVRAVQTRYEEAARQLDQRRQELVEAEQRVAQLESELQQDDQRVEQIKARLDQCHRELTRAQVQFATSEQRVEALRNQRAAFESDRRERQRAIDEVRLQLNQARQRGSQAELQILRLTSELAELFLRKERLSRGIRSMAENRRELIAERNTITAGQDKLRRQLRRVEEQQHKQELTANELRHERTALSQRMIEDYGIDLSQVTSEETEEEQQQRHEVEAEIQDLRTRINRVGAVNLDALEELDDLDERYQTLSAQFQDLTQAKESLERIIQKINADSRRLFMETLEAIRANFQVLYRKAFGGGRADLVLEDGKDVLECGVDIVATPPGKPSFNNSLLSGGEKALTAVSLLLAIFQFRPSPFCILDEVDAPFDEANIGRFVDVLKDFLDWTKFVIVTHSKKTMTAATTLYGVTMQESGVSKRVSVRFEDVSDDGHISLDAMRRLEDESRDDEQAA